MASTYLDHHAATPLCDAAIQAMGEAQYEAWANPSSVHAMGRRARGYLERARRQVAEAIGADATGVVLTSGGTEACNLGLRGLSPRTPRHVVTTRLEHPAVATPIAAWQADGARVSYLPVDHGGMPDAAALDALIEKDTDLVAIQWVNHETGTWFPIPAFGEVCTRRSVPLFVDATQALGKLPWDVDAAGATCLAVASPKIGGPAGAGAVWIARGRDLTPLLLGGGQERGRRPGSQDVVTQVGFGAACAVLADRQRAMVRLARLRDDLETAIVALGGHLNGASLPRVATVINASFPGRRGEALAAAMDLEGVCASSGAACSSGLSAPSPVLRALYPDAAWRAVAALRFSMGPEVEGEEVENARKALATVLSRPVA